MDFVTDCHEGVNAI